MSPHDQYRKDFIRELTLLGYAARVDHMNALTMEVLSPARYTIGYYLHGIQWRAAA